ncbi:hypothetical protein GWI33_012428, partial [Rhynchophorus ferrugineus]
TKRFRLRDALADAATDVNLQVRRDAFRETVDVQTPHASVLSVGRSSHQSSRLSVSLSRCARRS